MLDETTTTNLPIQPETTTPPESVPVATEAPAVDPAPTYAESSGEAKPAEVTDTVTPPASAESFGEAKPDVAEGYAEAMPATEISTPIDQNTAHTTPSQNLEIPNLVTETPTPTPLSESELLAAEIAQRKLLKPSNRFMRWLMARGHAAKKLLIRKKLDKIMALFNQHDKITNDLISKNLHIPDRTVNRYLNTLEKEGKIKQVGNAGRNIFYVKA